MACIFCPPLGAAGAAGLAVGATTTGAVVGGATVFMTTSAMIATTAALAAAAAGAIAGTIVDSVEGQKQKTSNAQEVEELRQKAAFSSNENHSEYISSEWNYIEKITTDFNRDTMTCKRCIVAKQCNKTKWHLFTDRTCSSWGDWEEPKCNELKF